MLRRYTSLPVLLDMLVKNRITVVNYSSWVDANDRHAMRVWQHTHGYGFVGAICLTEKSETFHHWQVFAAGPSGVCIVFDKDKLLGMFKGHGLLGSDGHFLTGPVKYLKLNDIGSVPADDIHRLPFLKRIGFRDEKEFRVIGCAKKNDVTAMHVTLDRSAIKGITLSPFMHPTLADSCKASIKTLCGDSSLKVVHSRLTDNQTWQKAISNFPSGHGTFYTP